jgi:hypothetical protein
MGQATTHAKSNHLTYALHLFLSFFHAMQMFRFQFFGKFTDSTIRQIFCYLFKCFIARVAGNNNG